MAGVRPGPDNCSLTHVAANSALNSLPQAIPLHYQRAFFTRTARKRATAVGEALADPKGRTNWQHRRR